MMMIRGPLAAASEEACDRERCVFVEPAIKGHRKKGIQQAPPENKNDVIIDVINDSLKVAVIVST
jgi:hypothetical protein